MTVSLRPYQIEAIDSIFKDWASGIDRLLLMAATGTGKTVIFLSTIDRILQEQPDARIVVIAHRRELIYQPIRRAEAMYPHLALKMGVVMASRRDCSAQIIIATVQSLVSGNCQRVKEIVQFGDIDYLICDESHRLVASTYLKVLEAMGGPKMLGCTATPKRTDNVGLGTVLKKLSYRYSIQQAIREGALVPFNALGFTLPFEAQAQDLEPGEEGEPEDQSLGQLLSADNILEIVFEKWSELAANRKTIGFTASVAQAHATAAYFCSRGIKAEAIDGTTPTDQRAAILGRYERGEIQTLWNCYLLVEGYDDPATNCIVRVAPTGSDLTFIQEIGRGLRTHPGKDDCLIIDFAPKNARDFMSVGDVLEGSPLDKKEKKAVEKAEKQGMLYGFRVMRESIGDIDPAEIQMKVLDYMKAHALAWVSDGVYTVTTLDRDNTLVLVIPDTERLAKAESLRRMTGLTPGQEALARYLGMYRLYLVTIGGVLERGEFPDLTSAQRAADGIGADYEDAQLASKKKDWRKEPATERQENMLRRLGAYEAGLTKGAAAQRITLILGVSKVKPVEVQREREAARNVQRVLITPAPVFQTERTE